MKFKREEDQYEVSRSCGIPGIDSVNGMCGDLLL